MQVIHIASQANLKIGIENTFTHYVAFLPSNVPLPTRWTSVEQAVLDGTSLKAAVSAKLKSLRREFDYLHDSMREIPWFQSLREYQNDDTFFDKWLEVDAMYRSRALDLPGSGHAMVPCVDLANHAAGEETVALYETDNDGDAVLLLRDNKTLKEGDEVTITYGDLKGACEMLFSYGFIDERMISAQEIFLDLEIPLDDPLKRPKMALSHSPPGVRLFLIDGHVDWESDFVWLICVNEEDGLQFQIMQQTSGQNELSVSWKDSALRDVTKLENIIRAESGWEVFELRVQVTVQSRVEQQLRALYDSENLVVDQDRDRVSNNITSILRLRTLEEQLLIEAFESLESKVGVYLPPSLRLKWLNHVNFPRNHSFCPQTLSNNTWPRRTEKGIIHSLQRISVKYKHRPASPNPPDFVGQCSTYWIRRPRAVSAVTTRSFSCQKLR